MPKKGSNTAVRQSHAVLYQKYRPTRFGDVRGQEAVIAALEGAVRTGRIPHALLFAGPRGTGKTSVARIFAREIGTKDIDVYEIDAASNRGIDDVRILREAVLSLPYESPYKVYIVDEVHMLTKEAFNALLKTLEEPPSHVIFILATTELDKLLETIVSRCQVYRFQAPSRALLRDTIMAIAKQEGFDMARDGADLIAIAADGSFRDALGITQKVITTSLDPRATAEEVARIVGSPRPALLMDIVEGLHQRDRERALHALREAGEGGLDMKLFSRLLLERMRTVILLRNAPKDGSVLLEQVNEHDAESIRAIAGDTATVINSKTLLRFLDAVEMVGRTSIPMLPLELALIDVLDSTQKA